MNEITKKFFDKKEKNTAIKLGKIRQKVNFNLYKFF